MKIKLITYKPTVYVRIYVIQESILLMLIVSKKLIIYGMEIRTGPAIHANTQVISSVSGLVLFLLFQIINGIMIPKKGNAIKLKADVLIIFCMLLLSDISGGLIFLF